jgi:hypothetical protein
MQTDINDTSDDPVAVVPSARLCPPDSHLLWVWVPLLYYLTQWAVLHLFLLSLCGCGVHRKPVYLSVLSLADQGCLCLVQVEVVLGVLAHNMLNGDFDDVFPLGTLFLQ